MKALLNRLYEHDYLSREEACQVLLDIGHGQYPDAQVAAFATVFNMRAIGHEELLGFRDALLQLSLNPGLEGEGAIDIVGTGGDGKHAFNISTTAALVVAGAGYRVIKHGSYGVSSAVGSSDVLMAMGYTFTNDPDTLRRQLDSAGICFLHAPLFHPALKAVVPVRRDLATRTFFNILGPLVNPAQPSHQLLGTYSLELSRLYAHVMQEAGKRYAVVYSLDGYDEASLTGPFKLRTNNSELLCYPEELGFETLSPDALRGGSDAAASARILRQILAEEGTLAQKSAVVVNAALAIQCLCPEKTMEACIAEAGVSLESGAAQRVWNKLTDQ